jgi:diguanylate cyclase (GGDEF)-like protein
MEFIEKRAVFDLATSCIAESPGRTGGPSPVAVANDWNSPSKSLNKNRIELRRRGLAALCRRLLAPLLAAVSLLIAVERAHGLDPRKQIGQYGHDSWTSQRGLPGEAVYQILQSKDGYLWVRTGAGLARFDGVRFASMDAEIGPEPVKAMCLNADGDLLLRTATHNIVYKDRRFSEYLPSAHWPGGGVRVVFESREHVLFVGSDNFIYRIEKNGEATTLEKNTGWVNDFLEDQSGRIWIAAAHSLFLYNDGRIAAEFPTKTVTSTITALAEDRQHRLWAASANGLYRLDSGAMVSGAGFHPARQGEASGRETSIAQDEQGNLWIGNETSGLERLTDGRASALDYNAGLTDNNVLSLFVDREGSVWIGTASGLDRLRDTKLITFTTREGLPTNRVKSVVADRNGDATVFTDTGGVATIHDGRVTVSNLNKQLPTLAGSAMFRSRDGSLWIGTLGGLSRIKDGNLTVYAGGGHFSKNYISAICEDDESLLVANSESRIFRFKPGNAQDGEVLPFTVHGRPTPLLDAGIYTFTMYRDPDGTLWFGTSNGLFKRPPGDSPKGGWSGKVQFDVTSIFDDHRGNLWLGGRTPGLVAYRLRDGRLTHYTKHDGLFDGFVSYVLAGEDGNLWMSAEDGIYSASEHDLDEFADGKTHFVAALRYGLADGLKTTESVDVTSQPAGARTSDGKLWFAMKKGVVEIDPAHLRHNELAPPVVIESVSANGATMPFDASLSLAPGTKGLEIQYTALSLGIPDRIRFKYQLDGYDHDWVEAGSRRAAYYTNLPPGEYRFRVIAANEDGVWNVEGATINITLKPFFYQTHLFFAFCCLLALLGAFAANRLNTRLIRARAARLTLVVEEKTAELRKSQSELEQLAHYDTLTGLPNRRKFTEDFSRMCKQTQWNRFSLLLIDSDKFKAINDTFGHDAGDAFLVEASRRLEAAVRASDTVARLGGDEFAILLTGEHDGGGIAMVCDRIIESFAAPIQFKGTTIAASVSIGVAVYPEQGDDYEKLFKSADLALYESKRKGGNAWSRHVPALDQATLYKM